MASQPWMYRRLTGKNRRLTGHTQLWLGPDHLLLVNSSRFVEHYQRFALADIAAIVVTDGPAATVSRFIGAAASVAWTSLALTVASTFAVRFFLLTGVAAIALVLLDILRGPRCRCHLYTAVSRELLTPVSRQRVARAFLAAIGPAIEAVQGTFPPERIAELGRMRGASPLTDPGAEPPHVPPARNYVQEVLFGLLLLDAVFLWIASRWSFSEAPGLLMTFYFAEIVLIVVALVRDARDIRRFSYAILAVALICYAADLVNVGRDAAGWFMQVAQSAQVGGQPPAVFWTPSARQTLFAEAWRCVAGAAGWLAIYAERQTGPAS